MGKRAFTCGRTGRRMELVFGMISTLALRHLSREKAHCRAEGPIDETKKQPTQGKAHDGGLRTEEMAVRVLLSMGVVDVLMDAMQTRSDAMPMAVCRHCGLIAVLNVRTGSTHCSYCDVVGDKHIIRTSMSYATVIIYSYLAALGIVLRFDPHSLRLADQGEGDILQTLGRENEEGVETAIKKATEYTSTPEYRETLLSLLLDWQERRKRFRQPALGRQMREIRRLKQQKLKELKVRKVEDEGWGEELGAQEAGAPPHKQAKVK